MFGLFKTSPVEKAKKNYKAKLTEAMNAQRSGDIQKFAKLSAEAEELLEGIKKLEENQS